MNIQILAPSLGDSDDITGIIANILIKEGDAISVDDTLLEVETDKVVIEIPSEHQGKITKLNTSVGSEIRQGDVLAELEVELEPEATNANSSEIEQSAPVTNKVVPQESTEIKDKTNRLNESSVIVDSNNKIQPAGPSTRRLARKLGIELTKLTEHTNGKRINKQDVLDYAKAKLTNSESATQSSAKLTLPDVSKYGSIHTGELSRIEIATSNNMTRSWQEVPHAWVTQKVDITLLEQHRQAVKDQFKSRGAPLTMTAIMLKVVAKALTEFPKFKAMFDAKNQQLVYRDYCHIGVAVDTPRGLFVPVIKDIDTLSGLDTAKQLVHLSLSAKEGKLKPHELQGSCFTISNLGGLGCTHIQPMVNWPEVAILGMASTEKTLVMNNSEITEKLMMPVTLGFDHRVINGADAAKFLSRIKQLLEQPMELFMSSM